MDTEQSLPLTRLMALQWLDLKKIAIEETKFRKAWNGKCGCKTHPPGSLPWCQHVRKAFNNKEKDSRAKVWQRTKLIGTKIIRDQEDKL